MTSAFLLAWRKSLCHPFFSFLSHFPPNLCFQDWPRTWPLPAHSGPASITVHFDSGMNLSTGLATSKLAFLQSNVHRSSRIIFQNVMVMKSQHEGVFGVMEWLTLYLDCGSVYMTMFIHSSSRSCILIRGNFTVCLTKFNQKYVRPQKLSAQKPVL